MESEPPELLFSLVRLDFLRCREEEDEEEEEGTLILSSDSVEDVLVSLVAAKIGSEEEAFNVMLLAFRRGRPEPRKNNSVIRAKLD